MKKTLDARLIFKSSGDKSFDFIKIFRVLYVYFTWDRIQMKVRYRFKNKIDFYFHYIL